MGDWLPERFAPYANDHAIEDSEEDLADLDELEASGYFDACEESDAEYDEELMGCDPVEGDLTPEDLEALEELDGDEDYRSYSDEYPF